MHGMSYNISYKREPMPPNRSRVVLTRALLNCAACTMVSLSNIDFLLNDNISETIESQATCQVEAARRIFRIPRLPIDKLRRISRPTVKSHSPSAAFRCVYHCIEHLCRKQNINKPNRKQSVCYSLELLLSGERECTDTQEIKP